MNYAGLFDGIGGFSYPATLMGWNHVFHCEKDDFCRKVLKYYWPHLPIHEDIKQTSFKKYYGTIDILSGGFPCQPYSLSGQRKGTEDPRNLWPEMLRAVREIRPRWIVAENVFGIISWNKGLVFEQIQSDLEAEGYEVQAVVLPAAGVEAPHERKRVFFIAYSNGPREASFSISDEKKFARVGNPGESQPLANSKEGNDISNITEKEGRQVCKFRERTKQDAASNASSCGRDEDHKGSGTNPLTQNIPHWGEFPTQSPICGRDDGISSRLDGITFPKLRRESIKAYGNAVVPQLVLQIYKAIEAYELMIKE